MNQKIASINSFPNFSFIFFREAPVLSGFIEKLAQSILNMPWVIYA